MSVIGWSGLLETCKIRLFSHKKQRRNVVQRQPTCIQLFSVNRVAVSTQDSGL
jgi:hypothetical protein